MEGGGSGRAKVFLNVKNEILKRRRRLWFIFQNVNEVEERIRKNAFNETRATKGKNICLTQKRFASIIGQVKRVRTALRYKLLVKLAHNSLLLI